MLSCRLIFYCFDDLFAIHEIMEAAKEYGFQFDSLFKELGIEVNQPIKIYGYTANFFGIEFDTLQIEARLSKAKLK